MYVVGLRDDAGLVSCKVPQDRGHEDGNGEVGLPISTQAHGLKGMHSGIRAQELRLLLQFLKPVFPCYDPCPRFLTREAYNPRTKTSTALNMKMYCTGMCTDVL